MRLTANFDGQLTTIATSILFEYTSFNVAAPSSTTFFCISGKKSFQGKKFLEGGHLLQRIVSPTLFRSHFQTLFVRYRSRLSNVLSAQCPILKFLSILGQNFFIFPL